MFFLIFLFYVVYRLLEMWFSRKNEKKYIGRKEYGRNQRKVMMILHTAWFLSILVEYFVNIVRRQPFEFNEWNYLGVFFLFIAMGLRFLSMNTLKEKWNIKIYEIKRDEIIKTGIYKYLKHPNYIAVVLEIFIVPVIWGLYYTAIIFSFLNIIFLFFRVKLENKVLLGEI